MWKPLLKYGGTFLLGFVSALILVGFVVRWGIHKLFVSREGFQGTNASGTESSATCAMMKLIIEKSQANLEKAKELADAESIKRLEASLESIQAEMDKMGC
jgi:nitrogenase molybdenum-iron protein alpha/beta subunit